MAAERDYRVIPTAIYLELPFGVTMKAYLFPVRI